MRLLALVLFAVASCCSTDEWELFKARHQKRYPSAEHEHHRRAIFLENLKEIRQHNLEADLQLHSWHMGLHKFSDMTDDEIRKTMTGYKQPRLPQANNYKLKDLEDGNVPEEVNWIERGYVNEVVNQGQCGSCYTFSSAVALEGQYKRMTGKLVKFSEQNLVDCSYNITYNDNILPNDGCNGGMMTNCFNYTKHSGGLSLEKDYPYKAKLQTCQANATRMVHFNVKAIHQLTPNSEELLKTVCGMFGPVSVAISTNGKGFMNYRCGVYDVQGCPKKLDHAVAVVGYGREDGKDYWLVRNSWGKEWGAGGYIKMARNRCDMCGIASAASIAQLSVK